VAASFRFGLLASVQFTLPFPLALGSRYLNCQSTSPAGGFCETVALKIAPFWFLPTLPPQRVAGACAATSASLSAPFGVAVDKVGNFYIADTSNHRVRKVDTSGIITTIAGNGTEGFSGDGGAATRASLNFPTGVTLDRAGNLFITDQSNHRIRKVNTNGAITTVAGNGNAGFSGDYAAAMRASLNLPIGTAVDVTGTLYIADTSNNRIRKVSADGMVTTVAGSGIGGFSGDGGAATRATLNMPGSVVVDAAGNLYIADTFNNRIRKLNTTPVIHTETRHYPSTIFAAASRERFRR
jgi:trimeric autotransporter adhesin